MNPSTSSSSGARAIGSLPNPPIQKLPIGASVLLGTSLLKNVAENLNTNLKLSKEDAIGLNFIFGPKISVCFKILEEGGVVPFRTGGGNIIINVKGATEAGYWILPGRVECQCTGYRVGRRNEMCKHILAANFALHTTTGPQDFNQMAEHEFTDLKRANFKQRRN